MPAVLPGFPALDFHLLPLEGARRWGWGGGQHPRAPKPRASSSPQSQDLRLALAADSTAGAGGTEGLEGALPAVSCHVSCFSLT